MQQFYQDLLGFKQTDQYSDPFKAREKRMELARDGVRKPVQVLDSNYRKTKGVCPWWDGLREVTPHLKWWGVAMDQGLTSLQRKFPMDTTPAGNRLCEGRWPRRRRGLAPGLLLGNCPTGSTRGTRR